MNLWITDVNDFGEHFIKCDNCETEFTPSYGDYLNFNYCPCCGEPKKK